MHREGPTAEQLAQALYGERRESVTTPGQINSERATPTLPLYRRRGHARSSRR
jgi:hypothetical protein